jgi:hypothetical protein
MCVAYYGEGEGTWWLEGVSGGRSEGRGMGLAIFRRRRSMRV